MRQSGSLYIIIGWLHNNKHIFREKRVRFFELGEQRSIIG